MSTEQKAQRKRGFASMDPEMQKKIASKGGRAVQEKGLAHKFTSTEASLAGRKGGLTVSKNREYMAEIGRKGGRVTANSRKDQ